MYMYFDLTLVENAVKVSLVTLMYYILLTNSCTVEMTVINIYMHLDVSPVYIKIPIKSTH